MSMKADSSRRTDGQNVQGCTEFFSNPQLGFATVHLPETFLFQADPASLLCLLFPSCAVAGLEGHQGDSNRVLLSSPASLGERDR